MQTVPDAIGGMIHNLAREDVGIAKLWAEEAAPGGNGALHQGTDRGRPA